MTAKLLIECLQQLPPDRIVMILDGFNGSGEPREINFQSNKRITESNVKNGADCCEELLGQVVTVLGYRFY